MNTVCVCAVKREVSECSVMMDGSHLSSRFIAQTRVQDFLYLKTTEKI